MELSDIGLQDKQAWRSRGYEIGTYDRNTLIANTTKHPRWIHFGAGNIFRSFPVHLAEKLIEEKEMNTGIIVAEGYDMEILDKAYTPFDNLSILATLKSDGCIQKKVLFAVTENLHLDIAHVDYKRLLRIFESPSVQLATFTITEKGYELHDTGGNLFPLIQTDLVQGPREAKSYIGKITALLYARYLEGRYPIAMVSLDNCSHNGDKLFAAIRQFAKVWSESNLADKGFCAYIEDEEKVSFPITMIDKITPRPSEFCIEMLHKDGIEQISPVKTEKGSFVAPFVNAEDVQYLVIEDKFPNGRPCLEKVGVHFCKREIVDKVERMKVCTCLNPLHTTLAIFGCLFHYDTIYECMQDKHLKALIEGIGNIEGLPVVSNPGIIQPKAFINEVIQRRFSNPFLPDTPQRIATDTSLKLGIRFGETIKAYQDSSHLDVLSLRLIPFVFAGWCRYLLGIDDKGNVFTCSDDPMLPWLKECLREVQIGKTIDVHNVLKPILSNNQIFQCDLYEIHMAEQVEAYFKMMIEKKGAVEESLCIIIGPYLASLMDTI